VLPGLIDSHQHGRGFSSLQQGIPDGSLEQWLVRLRAPRVSDVYLLTALAGIRLLRTGVTTTLHHHAHTGGPSYENEVEVSLQAYRDVGIRVTFALDLRDRNSYVYASDDEFVSGLPQEIASAVRAQLPPRASPPPSEVVRFIERLDGKWGSRIRFALGPQGLQWCSDASLKEVAAARRGGVPVHMHLLETRFQREYSVRTYGMSAVARLAELDVLGPNTSVAHAVWISERDLDLLASGGTAVVHNPSSNLRLRSGIAPVLPMLKRGIPVALGMDGMSQADRGDYFGELRLCSALHFAAENSLQSNQVWGMVYKGGARATFWGDSIGRLAPGSLADAVILRMPDPIAGLGVGLELDPLDRVLRETSILSVTAVVVDGQAVVRDGSITTVSESALLEKVADLASRVDHSALEERRRLIGKVESRIAAFYRTWGASDPAIPFYLFNSR
jgi:cytosine/adenosine deaminase-related metal-dependent hydrolase